MKGGVVMALVFGLISVGCEGCEGCAGCAGAASLREGNVMVGSMAGGRLGSVGVAMVPSRAAATRNGFCTGAEAGMAGGGTGRDPAAGSGAEQNGITGSVIRTGAVLPPAVGAVMAASVDQ